MFKEKSKCDACALGPQLNSNAPRFIVAAVVRSFPFKLLILPFALIRAMV